MILIAELLVSKTEKERFTGTDFDEISKEKLKKEVAEKIINGVKYDINVNNEDELYEKHIISVIVISKAKFNSIRLTLKEIAKVSGGNMEIENRLNEVYKLITE